MFVPVMSSASLRPVNHYPLLSSENRALPLAHQCQVRHRSGDSHHGCYAEATTHSLPSGNFLTEPGFLEESWEKTRGPVLGPDWVLEAATSLAGLSFLLLLWLLCQQQVAGSNDC